MRFHKSKDAHDDKEAVENNRYPPEGMENAVQTIMTQCELWTDNENMPVAQMEHFCAR